MNWANRLTILRIVLTPVFIIAVLYKRLDTALIIFVVAAITDGLDGYIARIRKEKTKLIRPSQDHDQPEKYEGESSQAGDKTPVYPPGRLRDTLYGHLQDRIPSFQCIDL